MFRECMFFALGLFAARLTNKIVETKKKSFFGGAASKLEFQFTEFSNLSHFECRLLSRQNTTHFPFGKIYFHMQNFERDAFGLEQIPHPMGELNGIVITSVTNEN